ncbi:ABC transporter ATP-binding protein [Verminephrobacter aporrectodeae subsp. tuberculatae]|uniref:ABC transporter ATP-binding protein n=1 Tax=Verminephrobacter aporrectodeae TaxID=1110389 RepID=UPI0022373FC0|nr:ABC transporter ATP-binding protein [Verminephrobacter aporrectodeae]MCW5223303.1 ABC transporter ATP-binding protein [Verminephrobacter aporrectodeae subsp. tuberculatae]MCW5288767.1 ABC transporter ATP-binding protein [Verminephrobacter aporrectodeae subsp. tuberculatae]
MLGSTLVRAPVVEGRAVTAALHLHAVGKSFGRVAALRAVTLAVDPGEYITILGPSGSGKSTLLRLIAGFDRPDTGRVEVLGQDLAGRSAHERGVGFVFQSFALFPHLSVFENLAFGLRYRRHAPVIDAAQVGREVDAALALVGLSGLGARSVAQISGGQKQRVALARCLVGKPRVVLLDEPLGALDANLRDQMALELTRIQRQLGGTFLHVTGNEQEALALGSRVAVLDQGALVQIDTPRRLFERPASSQVARLLNCFNPLSGQAAGGRLAGPAFDVPLPDVAAQWHGAALCMVRRDRVQVDADQPGNGGRGGGDPRLAHITGTYLASEYAGSRVLAIFRTGAGAHFEVEYHLSHRRPPAFVAGRRYALRWQAAETLAYAA